MLQTKESFFYPPTSSTFVSLLLNGLSTNTTEPASPAAIARVIDSCQFMIELAACDFFFIAHRASTIAVAAIVVTKQPAVSLTIVFALSRWLFLNIHRLWDYVHEVRDVI